MTAPVILALVGTQAGLGAIGAYNQGKAGKDAANYRAAVAGNNAIIAEQNAQLELRRGAIEEHEQRTRTAQLIGAQIAGYGAAGIDVASGTALRTQEATAELGETDAVTTRNNAQRRAYGWRTEAQNMRSESAFETVAGRNIYRAGQLGMVTSLVGGAASVGDKWATYENAGIK